MDILQPDYYVRAHHNLSLIFSYKDLMDLGYRLTHEGLVTKVGQVPLTDLGIEQIEIVKEQIRQNHLNSISRVSWMVEEAQPGSEYYKYYNDAYSLVDNTEVDTMSIEKFINKCAIESRVDFIFRWLTAKPTELISISIFPDEICASCTVGLHCTLPSDSLNGNYDYELILRFQRYLDASKVEYNVRTDSDGRVIEVITQIGFYREYLIGI